MATKSGETLGATFGEPLPPALHDVEPIFRGLGGRAQKAGDWARKEVFAVRASASLKKRGFGAGAHWFFLRFDSGPLAGVLCFLGWLVRLQALEREFEGH